MEKLFPKKSRITFVAEMNPKTQILNTSKELFFKLGVKSITMDDIAKTMGMSKKTLYKYFANKSDLVNAVLVQHFDNEKCWLNEITTNSSNAIEEIMMIAKNGMKQIKKIHPSSIYDLKKYYPKAWNIVEEYKSEYIHSSIIGNLTKGKEQGLYREEIQEEVIAKLYSNNIDLLVNSNNFPVSEYNFANLYKEFLIYHLHGIVTLKGYEYIKNNELEENE